MRKFFILVTLALVLLASAMLIVNSAIAAKSPIQPGQYVWELSNFKVTDPGKVENLNEGTFISGVILEAKAQSQKGQDRLFQRGTFKLELSVFSPAYDMPGQKAGMWYVTGEWSMVKAGASADETKVRHNPATISGKISSELDFNPLEMNKKWSALATVPMSTVAGQWGRGEGGFVFSNDSAANLSIQLDLWPQQ